MTDFSENVKRLRKRNNLSQIELAEKLFITPQAVSKWERGISEPELNFLCKLAKIFNTTTDELLGLHHPDEPECFMIGVDGGGTKTEFVLFSAQGEIVSRLSLGGSNPNMYGLDAAFSVLKKGINSFVIPAKRYIEGIYCGIAGCGSGDNAERLSEMLKATYPDTNILVTSDIENVVGSVSDVSDCIAVICGTGNIVYAKEKKKYHRYGGWGYLFDDAGSGYTIGRDALCAVLSEKDGTGDKTILTKMIEKKLGGNLWEKINVVYSKGAEYIALFSADVFEAYEKNDKVAMKILDRNFSKIAELINHAYEKHGSCNTAILLGGITKNKEVMKHFLETKVNRDIKLIFPDMPQIYGACRNCSNIFSEMGEGFEENFRTYYFQIMKGENADVKN